MLVPAFCCQWVSVLPTSSAVSSNDTGYHLAVGRWIVEHGTVPRADPFCFSTAGLDWINLNWLAQIGFYSVYSRWGIVGLLALRLLVMTGTLFFLWRAVRAVRAPPLPSLVLLALAAAILGGVPQVRPRLLTFLFVSGLAWGLARPDPQHRLGYGAAVAMTLAVLLLNNLHGGFAFAYAMLGADALGTAVMSWRAGGTKYPRRSLLLGGVVVVGLLGFGVHPHGFAALEHAALYTQRLGQVVIEITMEVQPADFTSIYGRLLEAGVAFALIGIIWGRRLSLREALVVLPFLQLALQMKRGLPLLALAGGASAARSWSEIRLGSWWRRANEICAPAWRSLGAALLGVALTHASLSLCFYGSPGRPNDVTSAYWNPKALPVGPARYLQAAGGTGRIFARFGHANLLEWALYPQRRVFLDGRTDIHARGTAVAVTESIDRRYPGWEERLAALEVEYVVLPLKARLAADLAKRSEEWSVVFLDHSWVVFRRTRAIGSSHEDSKPLDLNAGQR